MGFWHKQKKGSASPIILAAAVLDAQDAAARFRAMKQLLDIGIKRIRKPDAVIDPSEFTFASKGVVCRLARYPDGIEAGGEPELLYAKDAATQAVPASVTKLMALVTGVGCLRSEDEIVTIAASDIRHGAGDVYAAGDRLMARDLMLSMMLPSSNTAAQAFGRFCGEKLLRADGVSDATEEDCDERFLAEMNRKAEELGMRRSVFVSPSGLKLGNLTTADDLIRLIAAACSDPMIRGIWGEKTCAISVGGPASRTIRIHTTVKNAEIESSYYILGGKTGSFSGGAGHGRAEIYAAGFRPVQAQTLQAPAEKRGQTDSP